MRAYAGKWYFALRFGDLCFGVGNARKLWAQADLSKPHSRSVR